MYVYSYMYLMYSFLYNIYYNNIDILETLESDDNTKLALLNSTVRRHTAASHTQIV